MTSWQGAFLESIANELKNIREILEKQSTTEQSSMVGEWIFQECFDEHYGRAYECSLCGVGVVGKHNFCPNCGAKMKGADDE